MTIINFSKYGVSAVMALIPLSLSAVTEIHNIVEKDKLHTVTISTIGANGKVIADGVAFVKVSDPSSSSGSRKPSP